MKNILKILKREIKSFFIIFLLQLASNIYTTKSFNIVLIKFFKSWFATSLKIFSINYIYYHTCTIIKIKYKV